MANTAAAEKRRWKMAAYVARALAALPNVTSPLHRVTVDGVAHDLPAALVLVANCGELVPPFLRLRDRSEEHTSELQSLTNLVCRLLLEKKKNKIEANAHAND